MWWIIYLIGFCVTFYYLSSYDYHKCRDEVDIFMTVIVSSVFWPVIGPLLVLWRISKFIQSVAVYKRGENDDQI